MGFGRSGRKGAIVLIRDYQDQILKLKREKGAVILAHSYQTPDILEIADYTGDSYKLSVVAKDLKASTVIMCGVRFMAETCKILSPEKTVILPVAEAGCPMAEQIAPERVAAFKKEHPDYAVVAYVNTTAALKAVSDVCVTSSSALQIVSRMKEKNILFIPDKNLGSFVAKALPDRNILLWEGYCPVHNRVTEADCLRAKAAHPGAKLLMHPEIPLEAVAHADLAGSTEDILKYARTHEEDCIIGTENAICETLKLEFPGRRFWPLQKDLLCPDMKLITLADVSGALQGTGGEEILLDEEIRLAARRPIDAMIRLGQ